MDATQTEVEAIEVPSEKLSSSDERLEKLFDEMEKDSLKTLEDAARQIITLCTTLLAAFFGLLALKDAPAYLGALEVKLLAGLALGGFFLAALFAFRAVLPREYSFSANDLTGKRHILSSLLNIKKKAVYTAGYLFVVSTLLMLMCALSILIFHI